jgi:hypothetical protein
LITLSTSQLRVVIDPQRGAEIRSIIDSHRRCELLFQAPWTPVQPLALPASSRTWVEAWPGGWQVLFPNAGAQSVVDGRRHGFHGDASLAEWHVEELDDRRVKVTWRDTSGLRIIREIALDAQIVNVTSEVVNEAPTTQAFVFVEHAIFGGSLVTPSCRVELADGSVVPLEVGGAAARTGHEWPHVRRDGSVEDWSRVAGARGPRLGSLVDMSDHRVLISSGPEHPTATLTWSRSLPCLRLWQEWGDTTEPPWEQRTFCLGLEPASVHAADGLSPALCRGEATELSSGERWRCWAQLEVGFEGPR